MIAFDTNALVRMLIEDDKSQARAVQKAVLFAEEKSLQILILSEVIIETVWVLETVYQCTRNEVSQFLESLISTSTFKVPDSPIVHKAIQRYKREGDFADLIIVGQARKQQAKKFFSFDKKLQKLFPDYVIEDAEKVTISHLS
jgi:predicted nucleic-acid-binding protein